MSGYSESRIAQDLIRERAEEEARAMSGLQTEIILDALNGHFRESARLEAQHTLGRIASWERGNKFYEVVRFGAVAMTFVPARSIEQIRKPWAGGTPITELSQAPIPVARISPKRLDGEPAIKIIGIEAGRGQYPYYFNHATLTLHEIRRDGHSFEVVPLEAEAPQPEQSAQSAEAA